MLQTVGVRVVLLLPSKGSFLVIDDKVDREKGTFEPNVDVRGDIDQQASKGVLQT